MRCDAAVLGGGLAGVAASIHLSRAGLRVVCIEPEPFPHDRVGESLDWSAPNLLAEIGLPCQRLLGENAATFKRKIQVVTLGRPVSVGEPPEWWGAPPLRFERVTLHVDRREMDHRLFKLAIDLGVEVLQDRGQEVVAEGERVVAVMTAGGRRIEAPWFVDASGRSARLFARKLGIRRTDYGREKVSLWGYLDTPSCEGTTFYIPEPGGDYLSWIWEIPVTPTRASVGCVLEAEAVRDQRRHGRTPADILHGLLAGFPRFQPLLAASPPLAVRATGYRSFVHHNVCGPNWLLVGEAAALPDALTGNGVTAAFRHASESAELILEARHRGSLTPRQRRVYNTNVQRMGHLFNHGIETAVYDWPIRCGFGIVAAQVFYITCAFTMNALYTRARPRKWPAMLTFGVLTRLARIWINGWALVGRLAAVLRRTRAEPGRLAAETG